MEKSQTSIQLSNGYSMPIVGLGTWQACDENEVVNAIKVAIGAGYRHIDTAFVYENEDFIGKALHEIFAEGKIKRSDLFIVTKLPTNGHKDVEYFCRKSLKSLQLDYVDLYLIHSPVAVQRTENDNEFMPMKDGKVLMDPTSNIVETWKSMEALVDKGLTRSIGLSNFNHKQIQRIIDNCRIMPVNLQVECHVYLPQYELHEFCKKHNISFTAYSPLGSPGLSGFCKKKYGLEMKTPSIFSESKLQEISEKNGKTPAQILIRYLVQRGMIVIPKSSNPLRIVENLQVFDFHLSDDDMKTLKEMQNGYRFFDFKKPDGIADHPEHPFKEPY